MASRLLPLLLLGAVTSACGDPGPGSSSPDASTIVPDAGPHDPYTQPQDFPRDGCTGGLASSMQGVYHFPLDYGGGFVVPLVARVDDGTPMTGVVSSHDATSVQRFGDSDVIVYWKDDAGDVRALDLCGEDADGTVHAQYVRCNPQNSPACVTFPAFADKRLDPLAEPVTEGMHELGELGGDWPDDLYSTGVSVNVRVANGVAYVARYQDGLRVVDVHDPAHMTELAHLPLEYPGQGEIWNDVKLAHGTAGAGAGHDYALMASDLVGVVVVDVTTPSAPAIVAHFGTPPQQGAAINTHTIFVDSGKAYIATMDVGLEIWDIADPTQPVKLGTFDLPAQGAYLHDLYVSGDRAYLNFWDQGMAITDVTNPAAVNLLGQFQNYGETSSHSNWVTQVGARKVSIHGDEQWNAHIHIVDVTEGSPTFAQSIAEYETRPEVSSHNIMALGSLAIFAYYQDGVRALDLTDPTHPVPVGHFDSWTGWSKKVGYSFYEGAVGIDLDTTNRILYIADAQRGLIAVQLDI